MFSIKRFIYEMHQYINGFPGIATYISNKYACKLIIMQEVFLAAFEFMDMGKIQQMRTYMAKLLIYGIFRPSNYMILYVFYSK